MGSLRELERLGDFGVVGLGGWFGVGISLDGKGICWVVGSIYIKVFAVGVWELATEWIEKDHIREVS